MREQFEILGELDIEILDSIQGNNHRHHNNTVLMRGKNSIVRMLGNQIGGSFDLYVDSMVFGDGGEENQILRSIDGGRDGLFGNRVAQILVVPSYPIDVMNQVHFTATMPGNMAVGQEISEAALMLKDGSLFSMLVFPSILKTENRILTFNWTLTVV